MDTELKLSADQLAVMSRHRELLDAFLDIVESNEFKAAFGDMPLDEALDRYAATFISDDNEDWEVDLRQRYVEYQQHKDEPDFVITDDDDFSKLEAKYRK